MQRKARTELNELVDGKNLIESLEELYKTDMEKLISNYQAVQSIDYEILKELNVDIEKVKEGLRIKITGLKNRYWKELFNNFDSITCRLTKKSRESLLRTLTQNTSVDFTISNAYSIIIWAIKNANKYFDSQLLDLYFDLTKPENVSNYKSNNRIIEDGWRFNSTDHSHYLLDYRIVMHYWYTLQADWRNEGTGITERATDLFMDIFAIAENLGFKINHYLFQRKWKRAEAQKFYTEDDTLFAEIKVYKNGNIHFKFNQDFMRKLNVEAGRLNGWIKSPKDAEQELGITKQQAVSCFKSNMKLLKSNMLLLEMVP